MENEVTNIVDIKDVPVDDIDMYYGIMPGTFYYFVPEVFKKKYPTDQSKWPVFKLKPVNATYRMNFSAKYVGEDGGISRANLVLAQKETVMEHLVGWKNFTDRAGHEIPSTVLMAGEQLPLADFNMMPLKLLSELFNEIYISMESSKEEIEGLKF